VIADNIEGQRFWTRIGWEERTTLKIMSHDAGPTASSPGSGFDIIAR
jgi:hypothetical protein